ncbi:hypothetical protein C0J52_13949 [Blattella germanica]|nr:hypothetical protein C0J52_13949 [Blattella germanica]
MRLCFHSVDGLPTGRGVSGSKESSDPFLQQAVQLKTLTQHMIPSKTGLQGMANRQMRKRKQSVTRILSDGDCKTYSHLQKLAVYGPDISIAKEKCQNLIANRLKTGLKNILTEWRVKIPKAMLRYQPRGKRSLGRPMTQWSVNPQHTVTI